ncbi:tRNA uridine-5-carboxymethylaminomethyl(34) synthesis GTPase MnmE [candidate division KSB1 bacterium]|nr:tRNA uridine-5-carboxymethylaminomethyl(34) synthesis GTPase MnmE [candidate division KSB1 bacterium]
MIAYQSDTICALSTARGKSAIAIVRLSGAESIRIIDALFKSPARTIKDAPHASLTYGTMRNEQNGRMIDDVLVAKFSRPHSYTGEDLIEINCHGSDYIVQEIIAELLSCGARLAAPGEFTRRAFLNGKMDLLQAESVGDVIDAQTQHSLHSARRQLSGVLSDRLDHLREQLKQQLALLEIELDFSEDIELADRELLPDHVSALQRQVDQLIDSFRFGKIIREGLHLALIGKPNVGKSSILNRLLQEERAIVSEIPGTTRDVIQESLDIDGFLFKISDTAGIGVAKDIIESSGVARAMETLKNADQILFVVDESTPLDELDLKTFSLINGRLESTLLLLNKNDLAANAIDRKFVGQFKHVCSISAKTGDGFAELKKKLVDSNVGSETPELTVHINKVRHLEALRRSRYFLALAADSIEKRLSAEFIAFDVRAALDALGEITGDVTTEEILNDIFSSFCIGK